MRVGSGEIRFVADRFVVKANPDRLLPKADSKMDRNNQSSNVEADTADDCGLSVSVDSGNTTEDYPSDKSLTGYELVADMMSRQDAVIQQIDDLNLQIEAAIEALSIARKAELDAVESNQDQKSESEIECLETPALKKAA